MRREHDSGGDELSCETFSLQFTAIFFWSLSLFFFLSGTSRSMVMSPNRTKRTTCPRWLQRRAGEGWYSFVKNKRKCNDYSCYNNMMNNYTHTHTHSLSEINVLLFSCWIPPPSPAGEISRLLDALATSSHVTFIPIKFIERCLQARLS